MAHVCVALVHIDGTRTTASAPLEIGAAQTNRWRHAQASATSDSVVTVVSCANDARMGFVNAALRATDDRVAICRRRPYLTASSTSTQSCPRPDVGGV
jgi:hypothetical protein